MSLETGINITDYVPIPETDPTEIAQANAISEEPTTSHMLANEANNDDGYVRLSEDDPEVTDLGWNEPKDKVPAPLIGGIGNEELWMLVRRFNMQTYHVKEIITPAPGNLDMNVADEDEFSPDKLRSTVERLYMTIGIGLLGFFKHIVRIRSWKERRRTSYFCAAYFIAWLLDLLVPMYISTLIALIVYPPCRKVLFPPAPLALVDGKTGGVQKPRAGVLGSHDSATGAAENHRGEAVEAEAQNFTNGVASIALSAVTGKHPQIDTSDGKPKQEKDAVPDPTVITQTAANARVAAAGSEPAPTHDKTKVPMETAMWSAMRPFMHALNDLADGWERVANALSPTHPFPRDAARLRIAAVIIPILSISLVTTSYLFVKAMTFMCGFVFFGDPVVQPAFHWLNTKYPYWKKWLEPRNTILKGVPTNAQLTITLLRLGEANKAPIPPPPPSRAPPPAVPAERTDEDLSAVGNDAPLGATHAEIAAAAAPSTTHKETGSADIDAARPPEPHSRGHAILNFFRLNVKATVETAMGYDRARAAAGSSSAKNRIGVIEAPGAQPVAGPVDFKARYHGHKGHVYLSTKATIPCVSFSSNSSIEKIGSQEREDLHPVWSVAIADIKEIRKVGGFGWKVKLVVGWALDRTIADGLEVVEKNGSAWKVTACPMRDELFNRLVAMGGQKWESW